MNFEVDRDGASRLIRGHLEDAPTRLLSQHEAHEIFNAYGLPVLKNRLARTLEDVAGIVEDLMPPLAMKVMSAHVIHKSDVGGVVLGIETVQAARDAYEGIVAQVKASLPDAVIDGVLMEEMAGEGVEVIAGGHRDEKFGPMIMFGMGGRMVEVWKDVTFRLSPMWRISAERMIRQIRGFKLLQGVRGTPPSDIDAAAECILRLAQLMHEYPEIKEFDINPLILYPVGQGAAVADGRMTLVKTT
ncbi:acetate--CoA ligase family protein [Acidobacteriota bacterium]